MTDGAGRALVALELRRVTGPVLRMYGFTAVAMGFLVAVGWSTPGRLSFLLALAGFSTVSQIPMNALRDRVEGGLEFLTGLPVAPETLAAARIGACALAAAPGAALILAATGVLLGNAGALPRGLGWVPAAGLLAWSGVTAGASFITALVLRLQVSRMGYVPLALVLALAALDPVVSRMLPHPWETLRALAARPWLPQAAWAVCFLGCGVAVLVSLRLAGAAMRAFRPGRDRMTW